MFVVPPSLDELRRRLVGRATEPSEALERRWHNAALRAARSRTSTTTWSSTTRARPTGTADEIEAIIAAEHAAHPGPPSPGLSAMAAGPDCTVWRPAAWSMSRWTCRACPGGVLVHLVSARARWPTSPSARRCWWSTAGARRSASCCARPCGRGTARRDQAGPRRASGRAAAADAAPGPARGPHQRALPRARRDGRAPDAAARRARALELVAAAGAGCRDAAHRAGRDGRQLRCAGSPRQVARVPEDGIARATTCRRTRPGQRSAPAAGAAGGGRDAPARVAAAADGRGTPPRAAGGADTDGRAAGAAADGGGPTTGRRGWARARRRCSQELAGRRRPTTGVPAARLAERHGASAVSGLVRRGWLELVGRGRASAAARGTRALGARGALPARCALTPDQARVVARVVDGDQRHAARGPGAARGRRRQRQDRGLRRGHRCRAGGRSRRARAGARGRRWRCPWSTACATTWASSRCCSTAACRTGSAPTSGGGCGPRPSRMVVVGTRHGRPGAAPRPGRDRRRRGARPRLQVRPDAPLPGARRRPRAGSAGRGAGPPRQRDPRHRDHRPGAAGAARRTSASPTGRSGEAPRWRSWTCARSWPTATGASSRRRLVDALDALDRTAGEQADPGPQSAGLGVGRAVPRLRLRPGLPRVPPAPGLPRRRDGAPLPSLRRDGTARSSLPRVRLGPHPLPGRRHRAGRAGGPCRGSRTCASAGSTGTSPSAAGRPRRSSTTWSRAASTCSWAPAS